MEKQFTIKDLRLAFESGWEHGAGNYGGPNGDEEDKEAMQEEWHDYSQSIKKAPK